MSKFFKATCDASGKVFVEGYQIPEALLLSAGKAESQGTLFVDGELAVYLPIVFTDLETTLDKISQSLAQIASALTTVDAKPTGGTGSATVATVTSQVAQINTLKSELDALKGALK